MPVVILPAIYDKLLAPDTIFDCFPNINFIFMKVQFLKFLMEIAGVDAQIQEGRYGHIPADSGETVEVEYFLFIHIHFSIHLWSLTWRPLSVVYSICLRIRAARYAAPKPLSMFTTPIPPVQLLSIAKRAERTWKLAP